MEYRNLGPTGLKVSELSLGSWCTFGGKLNLNQVKRCMRLAFDQGVIFFDTAEAYGSGAAELLMGEALRDYSREEVVISTKIFFGGERPNRRGLSWKHLVEGVKNSLRRLQLEYIDLLYCHRPDESTPIEESVRAIDMLIKSGLACYWGTSEWSAKQIQEAHRIASEVGAIAPVVEQPEYNLFHRERVEKEYAPLYRKYKMGTTVWSPLDMGILSGKYNCNIPKGSRLEEHPDFQQRLYPKKLEKVKKFMELAKDFGCSSSQLAIAWCLKNPNVSTVIMGASNEEQLTENLKAVVVKQKLTADVMKTIEKSLS